MLCQVCGKNEANVEFTEIINDEVKQLQLCDGCAKNKGVEMEQHFSIADFLAGMSDTADEPARGEAVPKCEKCGMTFKDFQKIGRFGCGNCYLAFRKNLLPLIKRIHGSNRHMGKAVRNASALSADGGKNPAEITEFRHTLLRKLQLAIDKEEFEEAAKLRDMIRELEKKPRDKG